MTRSEAIAVITSTLPELDDAHVAAVAEVVCSFAAAEPFALRDLSADELIAMDRSKADFEAGRTYSLAEARALTEAFVGGFDRPRAGQ